MANREASRERGQITDGGNIKATESTPPNRPLRFDKIAQGSQETKKQFLEVPHDPSRPSSRQSMILEVLSNLSSGSSLPPSRSELSSGYVSEANASQRIEQEFKFPHLTIESASELSSGQISRALSEMSSASGSEAVSQTSESGQRLAFPDPESAFASEHKSTTDSSASKTSAQSKEIANDIWEENKLEQTGSRYISTKGWQGSPREVLEHLLKEALKLGFQDQKDKGTLKAKLYELQTAQEGSSQIYKPSRTFDEQAHFDTQFFDTINRPESVQLVKSHRPHVYFANIEPYRQIMKIDKSVNLMRMVLNIKPERIKDVTQKVVDIISSLDYVATVKITKNLQAADQFFDNVIIYFADPSRSEKVADLAKRLRGFAEDTRNGHAAMLAPIDPEIQGIAFGDNRYDGQQEYPSWGKVRAYAIAEAIWDLKEKGVRINFETLMPKVEERFREDKFPIDPENPHLHL